MVPLSLSPCSCLCSGLASRRQHSAQELADAYKEHMGHVRAARAPTTRNAGFTRISAASSHAPLESSRALKCENLLDTHQDRVWLSPVWHRQPHAFAYVPPAPLGTRLIQPCKGCERWRHRNLRNACSSQSGAEVGARTCTRLTKHRMALGVCSSPGPHSRAHFFL